MQIKQSEPAEYHTQRQDLKAFQKEKTDYLQRRGNQTDEGLLNKIREAKKLWDGDFKTLRENHL